MEVEWGDSRRDGDAHTERKKWKETEIERDKDGERLG